MNDSPQYSNRIKWNDSLRDDFRRSLIARLTDLNTIVNQIDISDRSSINSGIENFSKLLNDVAYPLFSKKLCINPPNLSSLYNKRLCNKADWFDEECHTAKQLYCNALQTFNHCKSNENRIIMCNLKLIYKRLVKRKKRLYENNRIREIERLRHAKPKDFWKLFTKKRNTNSNISLEDFFNYFSSLHQDLINVQEQESEEFCHNYDFESTDCNFEELDKPITVDEVEVVFRYLKRNKSFLVISC